MAIRESPEPTSLVSSLSSQLSPSSSSPCSRWWSKETVALVTGANKGIGYAVVKRLAELGLTVILTARDNARGLEAVASLSRLGLYDHVHFFRLDISDPSSISTFASWFQTNFHATLDILVNNAAVSFNEIDGGNTVERAETVIKTNFYGTKLVTQSLLPLFRPNSPFTNRILNISSRLGSLNKLKNPNIRRIFEESERLSEKPIDGMVHLFLQNVQQGTWKMQGWPEIWTDYAVSKLALNGYSIVLAKQYEGRGLSVNSFCPGFTRTSMTNGKGNYSADHVAHLVARLVLLPTNDLPTGKFYLATSSSRGSACNSKL